MPDARLLFVLSSDHGELALATSFVTGQEFSATFLLPERQLALHGADLGAPADVYRTVADVLARVDREAPDIVVLGSGYLLAANGLLTLDETATLVTGLSRRPSRIVTTDPFLGLLSRLDDATFSDRHPRRQQLTEAFSRLARIFAGMVHLYPVPVTDAGGASVSFFNEHTLLTADAAAAHARTVADLLGAAAAGRRWLFVLSHEDYGSSIGRHGTSGFEGLLRARCEDALREGRQPVLLAPAACREALAGTLHGLATVPFASQRRFTALLHEAEYVFYWNAFSNSLAARVANRGPVFFFDRGHLAHAMPAFWRAAVDHYWPDSTLPFLDPSRPLVAAELAPLAAGQASGFEPARVNFRRSPSPSAVVGRLLEDCR